MSGRVQHLDPCVYTPEELEKMLERMRSLNTAFYWRAADIGCHGFIEFCGLQSVFISLCEAAAKQGVQFPHANTHTGRALPLGRVHVEYLAEKFRCIFGPAFREQADLAELFVRTVFERVPLWAAPREPLDLLQLAQQAAGLGGLTDAQVPGLLLLLELVDLEAYKRGFAGGSADVDTWRERAIYLQAQLTLKGAPP